MEMIQRVAHGVKMVLDRLTLKPIDNIIYEIATNTSFVKAKANSLNIDKVALSFVEFDSHSKKLKGSIDIYMDTAEALALANEILSGKIPKLAAAEKAKGEQYPKEVYTSPLGGVNEEKAKERFNRTDGKAISRCFKLAPGAKADFVFTAEQRPGHTDQKSKIIVPEGGRPEAQIRVACTAHDLKKFALMIQMHIQAYYAAKYGSNGYARQELRR